MSDQRKDPRPQDEQLLFGPLPDGTPSATVERFTRGLADGELLASHCTSCQNEYLPPRGGCVCGEGDLEWRTVEPEGRLVAFTRVHYGPPGLAHVEPYAVGLVELEQGLRLLGWLSGISESGQNARTKGAGRQKANRQKADQEEASPPKAPATGMQVTVIPCLMAKGGYTLELVPSTAP